MENSQASSALKELIRKYNFAAPRYTSFPSAAQFHSNVDIQACRRIGEATIKQTPISVYVHIPFCHSLCLYCGCHTKIVHQKEAIQGYLTSLKQEIALTGKKLGLLSIGRIHFGGGSPNYIDHEELEDILSCLQQSFGFADNLKIDIECDPRVLTIEKIKAYARLGISRVSLGVQDFNADVQAAVHRIQPFEQIKSCADKLRSEGIEYINFDLMTGLPKQNIETAKEQMEKTILLNPSRIAVFPYAHVPWMKKHQRQLEVFDLPDALQRFNQSEVLRSGFILAGYKEIGMDHFAKAEDSLSFAQNKKTLRRNFQGYTDDPSNTILGFGLSAISRFPTAYLQNTVDALTYKNSLAAGKFPATRGIYLSGEDKIRSRIIDDLMCFFQAPLTKVERNLVCHESLFEQMREDGLIEMREGSLIMVGYGKHFVRLAAACFDPHFSHQSEVTRHAKVI